MSSAERIIPVDKSPLFAKQVSEVFVSAMSEDPSKFKEPANVVRQWSIAAAEVYNIHDWPPFINEKQELDAFVDTISKAYNCDLEEVRKGVELGKKLREAEMVRGYDRERKNKVFDLLRDNEFKQETTNEVREISLQAGYLFRKRSHPPVVRQKYERIDRASLLEA